MKEQLKELRALLNEGLVTREEFEKIRKNILAGEQNFNSENTSKNNSSISNKKLSNNTVNINWKIVMSVITIFLIVIIGGVILIMHNNKVNDKRDFAQQITNETNYTVKYVANRDAFEYFSSGDWQTELTNNVEEYASENQVRTSFIKDWRGTVITSFQDRSQQRQGKGSRFEIINPENDKKTLLVIKNGKVVQDAFSDITYDYNN